MKLFRRIAGVAAALLVAATLGAGLDRADAVATPGGGHRALGKTTVLRPGAEKPLPQLKTGTDAVNARRYVNAYGPVVVPAGENWTIWANCPAGYQAVGGGESTSTTGPVTLHQSYAADNGVNWTVTLTNGTTNAIQVRVYAVCFSGIGNYQHRYDKRVSDPAVEGGAGGVAFAYCPDGTVVLGGGTQSDDLFGVAVGNTGPGYYQNGWGVLVANYRSTPGTVTAQAICGTGVGNYQRVLGPTVDLPSRDYRAAPVNCPPGTVTLGGGSSGDHGNWYWSKVTDTYPTGDGSWAVYFRSVLDRTHTVRSAVVCGS